MNYAARSLQRDAKAGFKRTRNFRAARMLYLRAYTGQYYDQDRGELGVEPMNLAFNAIRVLVPNLVTRVPKAIIDTEILAYREYGNLLQLSLRYLAKKLKLPEVLQRGIVDAIFTLGIFKVGLSTTDSLIYFGDEGVDPGRLYIETVDFDNFTFDPTTNQLMTGEFIGEKMRVKREFLLESGLYDNEIVERLPSSADITLNQNAGSRGLSSRNLSYADMDRLREYVDLIELWMPDSNTVVTIPFDGAEEQRFLRQETFYGPDDGPYAFLSLTPPVPNNPLPVSLAGIWHDLHVLTNRIIKKTMDQAEAQKDILGYQSDSADDAQEIVDAKNLDAVKMENPSGAQMFSFGGQNPSNERFIPQLTGWFNTVAGNIDQMGGLKPQTNVATVANIMNTNAGTGMTFMREAVGGATNSVLRKAAWYLHTDPLINLPLIRRDVIPAQYAVTDLGIQMVKAPHVKEVQVFLTPEVRRVDFLDFAYDIEHDSMAPIDAATRIQQLDLLSTKIIPSAANASMVAAQMGTPFSFEKYVVRIAKLMGLDWIDEIFQSPELVAQVMAVAQKGPQPGASKGITSPAATQQNGGAVVGKISPDQLTQQRQGAQAGAASSQAALPIREV